MLSPRRQVGEEVLRGVELLEAGHPAQVVRELLQLVVIQLEGDQTGQTLQGLRYVLQYILYFSGLKCIVFSSFCTMKGGCL